MKKILIHSVAPGVGTGYGGQAAQLGDHLSAAGYDVAYSAYAGIQSMVFSFHECPVYPGGVRPYGQDVLKLHAKHFGADLVITLLDVWALGSRAMEGLPVACWTPLDAKRITAADSYTFKRSGAVPVAMSRHGERVLSEAGLAPLYVPHGLDAETFRPLEDPQAQRESMGLGDRFVIFINAQNLPTERKGWYEQFRAFAALVKAHPDAALVAHTIPDIEDSPDLKGMAEYLGIPSRSIFWTDAYPQRLGSVSAAELAGTYGAAHLYTQCSWGEGFGLCIVESQLCGVPAVATDCSSMPEVCDGWLVEGQDVWNGAHRAEWCVPNIAAIRRVYDRAYRRAGPYQAKAQGARKFAMRYEQDHVFETYWRPALAEIEKRIA
jgi:glycosyltransferase involved in cell wall biosynthesis